jgi:hypothetical protein
MAKKKNVIDPPTRRAFLLGLTAVSALPAFSDALAATPAPAAAAESQAHASNSTEVDALMAIVTSRYGSYLQSAELTMVGRGLERLQRNAAELLKVPIHNGDAPDCLFHPDGL